MVDVAAIVVGTALALTILGVVSWLAKRRELEIEHTEKGRRVL